MEPSLRTPEQPRESLLARQAALRERKKRQETLLAELVATAKETLKGKNEKQRSALAQTIERKTVLNGDASRAQRVINALKTIRKDLKEVNQSINREKTEKGVEAQTPKETAEAANADLGADATRAAETAKQVEEDSRVDPEEKKDVAEKAEKAGAVAKEGVALIDDVVSAETPPWESPWKQRLSPKGEPPPVPTAEGTQPPPPEATSSSPTQRLLE